MTYTSMRFTDSDGRVTRAVYHHPTAATLPEIESFWTARLENLDDMTKLQIAELQIVVTINPLSLVAGLKAAPLAGSAVNDEELGIYASTASGRPLSIYIPDIVDALVGAGGEVTPTAELTAFVGGAITGGSGTGAIRLADQYGEATSSVRYFRPKRASKR